MATWTNDELDKIAGSDELRIASLRRDGRLNSPPGLDDDLDAAYRAKYRRYSASSVGHITSPQARAATIRLEPKEKHP